MENKAAFSLERYHFSKVIINLENKKENNEFNLNIIFYTHSFKTKNPFEKTLCEIIE